MDFDGVLGSQVSAVIVVAIFLFSIIKGMEIYFNKIKENKELAYSEANGASRYVSSSSAQATQERILKHISDITHILENISNEMKNISSEQRLTAQAVQSMVRSVERLQQSFDSHDKTTAIAMDRIGRN